MAAKKPEPGSHVLVLVVDPITADRLRILAHAWDKTPEQVVDTLVEKQIKKSLHRYRRSKAIK